MTQLWVIDSGNWQTTQLAQTLPRRTQTGLTQPSGPSPDGQWPVDGQPEPSQTQTNPDGVLASVVVWWNSDGRTEWPIDGPVESPMDRQTDRTDNRTMASWRKPSEPNDPGQWLKIDEDEGRTWLDPDWAKTTKIIEPMTAQLTKIERLKNDSNCWWWKYYWTRRSQTQ